jgi:hypothetical protein
MRCSEYISNVFVGFRCNANERFLNGRFVYRWAAVAEKKRRNAMNDKFLAYKLRLRASYMCINIYIRIYMCIYK